MHRAGVDGEVEAAQDRLDDPSRLVGRSTRSGKILRGTMKKIADGEPWTMPATIDDPLILDEIGSALKGHGLGGKRPV